MRPCYELKPQHLHCTPRNRRSLYQPSKCSSTSPLLPLSPRSFRPPLLLALLRAAQLSPLTSPSPRRLSLSLIPPHIPASPRPQRSSLSRIVRASKPARNSLQTCSCAPPQTARRALKSISPPSRSTCARRAAYRSSLSQFPSPVTRAFPSPSSSALPVVHRLRRSRRLIRASTSTRLSTLLPLLTEELSNETTGKL